MWWVSCSYSRDAATNGPANKKYESNLIALDWASSYALSAMAVLDSVGHLSTDILLVNAKIAAKEKWQLILFRSRHLGLLSLGCQPAASRCGIGLDIFIRIGGIGDSIFILTAPTHTTTINDNYYRGCVLEGISIMHMRENRAEWRAISFGSSSCIFSLHDIEFRAELYLHSKQCCYKTIF